MMVYQVSPESKLMLYGVYHFYAIFEDEAVLPAFKGSTFRGVFGHALKEVVCALKRQECPTCLLRRQCVYLKVFATLPDLRVPGRPSPPHPFVIEPPITGQTHYQAGEPFDFTLLLFGLANQYLPYFVYAVEQMGQIGVGRQVRGKRARFQLRQVRGGKGAVYNATDRCLLADKVTELTLEAPPPGEVRELSVALLTPLRLKYQEHLHAALPFHILIRAALRRIAALHNHFGNGEPPLDYQGLVARAQEVNVAYSRLRWVDWQRYSSRQESSMLLGGMVGEATYQGNLGEFVPLLRYAEKVHLGKATTFGLGKIQAIINNAG